MNNPERRCGFRLKCGNEAELTLIVSEAGGMIGYICHDCAERLEERFRDTSWRNAQPDPMNADPRDRTGE